MVTDGEMTKDREYKELSVVATDLKNKGVEVIAVGVGRDPSREELRVIASTIGNVFTVDSFDDMQALSSLLRSRFCEGEWHVSRGCCCCC